MRIKKCDICKKQVKGEELSLSFIGEKFQSFEFCLKCSQPIMKFLKSKKLIKSADEKRK
ncbi:MAG: hypothetical protein V1845_04110 [bacterium]